MRTDKFLICGMILLGAAAGCSKETPSQNNETQEETGAVFTLCADLPEGQDVVKTALGSNYEIVWKTGNKVSINGTVSNAVASGDNGKRSVDFTFSKTPSSPYNVLYPGTTSTNVVTFPATQNYIANTFDDNAAPSYGVANVSGNKATCKLTPLNAVIRLALNGTDKLESIKLSARGGESIAGTFTVNFSTGVLSPKTAQTSLMYDFGDNGLQLTGTDTYMYLVVPVRSYTKGFEALVYRADGKYMRLTFMSGANVTAGKLFEMESKTFEPGRAVDVATINELTSGTASFDEQAEFTDFEATDGGTPTTQMPGITVATYNVLITANRTSVMSLTNSKGCLGTVMLKTNADVICFNEIDKTFATDGTNSLDKIAVAAGMNGYEWHIQNPNVVDKSGSFISPTYDKSYSYANGFAFKTSVLELVEKNYYWYDDNKDYTSSASTAYNNGHLPKYRTIVWAKFRHKESNKTFNVISTHMPNYDDGDDWSQGQAHQYAAYSINQFVQDKDPNSPWLLCGDLNTANVDDRSGDNKNNYAGYCILRNTGNWVDSYEYLDASGLLTNFYRNYIGTQSGSSDSYYYDVLRFCKNHPERRIDHIMVKKFRPETYRTIRLNYQYGEDYYCPSDHLPVIVYVSFTE
ncbi:MAG: endonuclease/exonuclease/phosphatase family protein [Bacteroidales bacterium]|nr:endonuclease/exonuclease/phosphatase family protein [Bacteroidales bacterium]